MAAPTPTGQRPAAGYYQPSTAAYQTAYQGTAYQGTATQPGWPGSGWPSWPPTAPIPAPPRRGPSGVVVLIGLVIVALIIGVAGAYLLAGGTTSSNTALSPGSSNQQQQQQPNTAPSGPQPQSPSTTAPGIDKDALAAQVSPAIVDINTTLGLQDARAAGTGIVLTADGVVLTNNHVIAGETELKAVDVGDGHTYTGTVLGYSTAQDIAVIKLANASGLTTAVLGDSSKVQVGDSILALGNAGGVGGTPAAAPGQVIDTDRAITATDEAGGSEHLTGLIEIAADIEPGDSGGPLVNAQAQVIGVDTAASSGFHLQNSGGRGFAIPINAAIEIANKIINGQSSSLIHIGPTAFLGILTNSKSASTGGASVADVVPNSPADRAGIRPGDTIATFDGSAIDDVGVIGELMIPHHPGDSARVRWVDTNGNSHEATVTLASGPPA